PVAEKEEAKPSASAAPAPATEAPVAVACAPCAPCCKKCGHCRRVCNVTECHYGFCQRINEWLCYRPLQRPGICGCCQKCNGGRGPLFYSYFLDRGEGGGCPGCALPAAPTNCCSGGACRAHP